MNRRQFLAGLSAVSMPLVFSRAARAADVTMVDLQNAQWRVQIDPLSLMIRVQPANRTAIEVSRGVAAHRLSDLIRTDTQASWTWDGQYRISCNLHDGDLNITITASQPGDLDLIDQPPAAMAHGMMLPLAEGHYVPGNDTLWRDFLIGPQSEMNTTEDMSLPLWGLDHGEFTLHWLLTNPFNNVLRFSREGDGIGLKVAHSFTSLSPTTPMTMILHLADADRVAGARRYRRHLIDSGVYETLADKIAKTPGGQKLIGASQIYLWGNGLIGESDVLDWPGFIETLRGNSPLAVGLRGRFESDAGQLLTDVTAAPYAYQRGALVSAFNDGLESLARAQWQVDEVSMEKLVASYADLRHQAVQTFGKSLAPDPAKWGAGLSQKTFQTLQDAGLKQLWIGLGGGWEGGLWRPEAVRAAVAAGYLIAPYDSYETAIKPGHRPDWATAQLGEAAFETAGVIKKDGKVTSGFEHTGHYTNTISILPILKARVAAVAKAAGFNSWFIDCFSSGMVFDDYRAGHEMTMAQNAAADVEASRWISQTLQLPVGSEDGNAVTAGGVMFAHGMESPIMAWGDPDFTTKTSPYYLGAWYPDTEPAVFFKPVPMKEPYRTLSAPRNRLPLYQSVFHGSVITTHQWAYDNLKLSNVMVERELAQLLYNVPPLYHLSEKSLLARLPVIQKQDKFFRPLHEALAEKTMDGFAWLSDDRLVQSTSFSDGSRLIANFDKMSRQADGLTLGPYSITAILAGQTPEAYSAA